MEKKKTSYDAKKEKLLYIKKKIEHFYEMNKEEKWDEKEQNIMIRLTLDLIWEIVKDEKAK